MNDYHEFLKSKALVVLPQGKEINRNEINPILFDFQKDIVKWACLKGRAALFTMTGTGKTLMYCEWARLMGEKTLMLAPLSVARQTVREAKKLGLDVRYVRSQSEVTNDHKLWITNYEMLDHFDFDAFGALVCDESSILKSMRGATKTKLIEKSKNIPYRLACTATPAPNDIQELGSHAEFLGIMKGTEMTSVFFVHDAKVFQGTASSRWRLKRHAKNDFYRWLASWAISISTPSDIGYSDEGYILPELTVKVITTTDHYTPEGMLPGFNIGGISATNARKVRRNSIETRADIVADLISKNDSQWIVWTGLLDEDKAVASRLEGCQIVEGKMKGEKKADYLEAFIDGKYKTIITKPSIAGYGVNLQNCHNIIFMGIDYSWEDYFQTIRRVWRFGQTNPVNVYVVISEQENSIFDVIMRKEKEAMTMMRELVEVSREYTLDELKQVWREFRYATDTYEGNGWTLMLGDSCERLKEIPDNSVGLSIYSPPFSDLYVYNNSERDLSNSTTIEEFMQHYGYIIRENLRVTMPGRVVCVHVQDVKQFKNRHGYRGLKDFSGLVIDAYASAGWEYRACITVDKNPQIAASRNKDSDLLFITGKRDSTDLAPVPPDYVLVFRKPGDNPIPVTPYANGEMNENQWIEWAHAIWYDIKETDVLNVRQARDNDDERHMTPLQLSLIERCVKLWSNPTDLVLDCFAGIGSTGYVAIPLGRKFIGCELKESYYRTACKNLGVSEGLGGRNLFDWAASQAAE